MTSTIVRAEDRPVVIELFTSQGCNACPPADEIMTQLAQQPGVIALALHVDYWDYIGWADSFANPAFTERQKRYAIRSGARSVFTPQFVIGGSEQVVGAYPVDIMEAVQRQAKIAGGVVLDVERDSDELSIRAGVTQSFAAPLVVQVVRYRPEQTVEIERGENEGMTVSYANIVTKWDQVGEWDTVDPLDVDVPIEGDDPAVVILQEPGAGPIVAAEAVQ